jgi:hypothetical protein
MPSAERGPTWGAILLRALLYAAALTALAIAAPSHEHVFIYQAF